MFEVIVAVIYRNLMCVYSRCLHFCNGSCASLCIIDVSRDKIVKNILEINATVQKTVKTIEICMTNVKETSAMNQLKWVITFWDVLTTESHHWTYWSIVEDSKSVTRTICGECGDGSVSGVHFQKPISLLLMKNHQHVWLRELHQMQIDNKTLYSKYLSSAKEPLELVHSVICGSPQIALRGTLYMLLFIEDITRHAVEYILLYKSEAMEILFKELTASKEKELGKQVKQCWTAGGGEYTSKRFAEYQQSDRILKQTTVRYSPQSNGVVERVHCRIREHEWCLLHDALLSMKYWAFAVLVAVCLMNLTPTHSVVGISPHAAWHWMKSFFKQTWVFGCLAFVSAQKEDEKQLDYQATASILIWYSISANQYLMHDPPAKMLHCSWVAVFREGKK